MDEDYKRFCLKCGCVCPDNEELWQCPMYIHYHPEEVEMFNKSFQEVKR